MGITARGAWEAVKRHFREMGKDIQTTPFTVAGVGDMSGDVFGNGMLLSEQIQLVAAFDHRDIFIDPSPDPETSFAERKRLFEMPRSSWQDYEKSLISKGGGVFSRTAKSIPLSTEMKEVLSVDANSLSPNDLIAAILRAPVELFWLGGIGTYFKSTDEENWQVGDRANDLVRINAEEMRMQVVGEGANLGLTQKARIVFARQGGRINTDAIDNSAGVDSSDHEVNIKILLSEAIEKGELKSEDRNDLLREMTEDVARHVLVHNYEQTRALSQKEATAAADLDSQSRLMIAMEQTGLLDRDIEDLPDSETISTLMSAGEGLTRPEISVLLAYAKNWLFDELVESSAPDDPALEGELFAYFPAKVHHFNSAIIGHPLKREIVATRLANEIVDTCGPSFPFRAADATGARYSDIALSYEAARRILDLGAFADSVDALDNKTAASLQIDLYNAASTLLREQMYRIASGARTSVILEKRGVTGLTDEYAEPVSRLKDAMTAILSSHAREQLEQRVEDWIWAGAPEALARDAAIMPSLELVFDIVNLANETGWPIEQAGAAFFAIGSNLQIDLVRTAANDSTPSNYYDKLAKRRLSEDLALRQTAIAQKFLENIGSPPDTADADAYQTLLAGWRETDPVGFVRYDRFINELEIKGDMSVSKLSLLNRKLFDLEERLKNG